MERSAGMMVEAPLAGERFQTRAICTRADMEKISKLVYASSGIALNPDTKQTMVMMRLQKRLRTGGFSTVGDYLRFMESDRSGRELRSMLDVLTTNHTSFFREPKHFEVLSEDVIGRLVDRPASQPINGWCAACATGEEAYSIIATVMERLGDPPRQRFRLLASDLSSRALETAQAGVYATERIDQVPKQTLRRFFERGVGEQQGLVRVKRETRQQIEFRRLNLIEADLLRERFDFIFCRNVMIYFDAAARQRVVSRLEQHLAPGGYLFVSQSESLSGVTHGLQWHMPGVYQRSAQ
jgi:chemotaxis protein methyltransferase CheR